MVDPGPLLSTAHRAGDLTVRLRLARPSDAQRVRAFLERHAPERHETVSRLVFFDPRRRLVLVATAPVEAAEHVVGLLELEGRDPRVAAATPEVDELLWSAARTLVARARDAA